MNTSVSISYNTSSHSRVASSYTLSICETEAPATGALRQQGENYNNIVNYSGVFDRQSEAVAAALAYIDGAYRILELDTAGTKRVILQSMGAKPLRLDEWTTARVLGSKSAKGVFVATNT